MQHSNRPSHVRLAEWWTATSSGVVGDRTDPAEIAALEQRYGIALPTQFRDYLISSCPQNDPSLDNELTNWWPFARLKNITDEYHHASDCTGIRDRESKFIFFADYSIWCWAWAVCCDESEHRGKVAVIGDGDRFVASTFAEFVDRYIADPAGIALSPAYPANGR